MPAILSASQHDVAFHYTLGDTHPPLDSPENVDYRYPHTKTPNQQFSRQHNDVYHETRGVANGEMPVLFRRSRKHAGADVLLSAHPKPLSLAPTLPLYFQRWLANSDSDDEEDTHPPPTVDQDFMDSDADHGYPTLRHDHGPSVESHYTYQALYGPFTVGELVDPDELFGEAAVSFASEYLNLDYQTSTFANNAIEVEVDSPSASSDSSTSPTSTSEDEEMQWEVEPTSLSLLNATRFETGIDTNGVEMRYSWPWGNYTYRPPSPPRYFDSEEYARELQFMRIEDELRDQLAERFAEEAIRDGEKAKAGRRKGGKKGDEVEKETSPPIIAFSQVIRGRTIYNP
jgi:hypothetical protein